MGCVVRKEKSVKLLNEALHMLAHRGPDHSSFSVEYVSGFHVYLGHTRLSIIDLSERSVQPFQSRCGRFSLVFNGEIYNYKELRARLKLSGHVFMTESDTEVLLYALVEWGLACLPHLIGMFSFVFYDKVQEKLTLARDAFGIKPFFYGQKGRELFFSSELPPLLHLRQEVVRPHLQRAYDYLVHGDYDSCEESFVDGVKHLPPAHYFTFDIRAGAATPPTAWWVPDVTKERNIRFDEAAGELRRLFLDSVRLHLRSDVPLGVALSGGLDSSSVVSAVRYLEPEMPLHTFSYVASDPAISEEKWVDLLNKEKNARPNKVSANEREMEADIAALVLGQGEPFGSTSIYAQYRVFKLAKATGITVMLDGQGADELLAGYSGFPGQRLLTLIETEGWLAAHRYAKRWGQAPGRSYCLAWKHLAHLKFPDWLNARLRKQMGRDFAPAWLDAEYLAGQGVRLREPRESLSEDHKGRRVKEALASRLMGRGLPSLLRHGDRNSMAFSIESRVPFLTLPLVEFLLSLPEQYLISRNGVTKHVFREAMRGIVPDTHLNRKDKIGFTTPEAHWLLSIEDLIRSWIDQGPEIPFLHRAALLQEFGEFIEGKRSFDGRVWRWVNYLRWYSLFIKGAK